MQNIKELKFVLDTEIARVNQVFIVPHKNADFDAFASAIGVSLIVKKLNKPVYIILEEEPTKIEPGIKKMVEDIKDTISIINLETYKNLKSENDLLITTDVNKDYLICCNEYLDTFKSKILIDHHKEDERTIDTEYKYILPNVSSTSEIITELLCLYKIKYSPIIANFLLAGIYLDTNKYTKNTSSKTMSFVSKLLDKGADIMKVNEFFEEDFYSDRKVQDLVSKANFITYSIALCIANDDIEYTKEELAKVADYLLRYKVDAAFAVGKIDEEQFSISARSKGKLDVSKIMHTFNGGGNVYSGASKINDSNIEEISKKLEKAIRPTFYNEETK